MTMDGDAFDVAARVQATEAPFGDERTREERGLESYRAIVAAKGGPQGFTADQVNYLLDMQSTVDEQADQAELERLKSPALRAAREFGNIHSAQRAGFTELVLDGSEGKNDNETESAPSFDPIDTEAEFGLEPGAARSFGTRGDLVRKMIEWMTQLDESGGADPEEWFNGRDISEADRAYWAEVGRRCKDEAVALGSTSPDTTVRYAMGHAAALRKHGYPVPSAEQLVRRVLADPNAQPAKHVRKARPNAPSNIHMALQRNPF